MNTTSCSQAPKIRKQFISSLFFDIFEALSETFAVCTNLNFRFCNCLIDLICFTTVPQLFQYISFPAFSMTALLFALPDSHISSLTSDTVKAVPHSWKGRCWLAQSCAPPAGNFLKYDAYMGHTGKERRVCGLTPGVYI